MIIKFKSPDEHDMQRYELEQWHRWFAWFPVFIYPKRTNEKIALAWLMYVERKGERYDGWYFTYRFIEL